MLNKSRSLLANQDQQTADAKRKTAAEHVAAEMSRRVMNQQDAAEKKYKIWCEAVYPAEHAASMNASIKAMDHAAISHRRDLMTHLQNSGAFRRWITIPFLWEPDDATRQNFGFLPSVDNMVSAMHARRPVRCSSLLAIFIKNHTEYQVGILGPDPQAALVHLLGACFVNYEKMFVGAFSPYYLLVGGNLVMDLAFMHAVVAASKWLGVGAFPEGHISTWPPPKKNEWL